MSWLGRGLPGRIGLILLILLGASPDLSACSPPGAGELPPGFGGVNHSVVSLAQASRWIHYRQLREQERFLESIDPDQVRARYRALEQGDIDAGCIPIDTIVDVGRALFLRTFTMDEGLGNDLAGRHDAAGLRDRPNLRRFGSGTFGGPEARSCRDCHWRGGMAGAGDRADNVYLGGDGSGPGDTEELQAPALWGSAWLEIIAAEISEDLQQQRDHAISTALATGKARHQPLSSKGVDFGAITVEPRQDGSTVQAEIDLRSLRGVAPDLLIRPYGWRGRYATLREAVAAQLHLHLGLQAEELLAHGVEGALSNGLSWLDHGSDQFAAEDADGDGVVMEITPGQLTALTVYLATLPSPVTRIPTRGPVIGQSMTAEVELAPSSEWAHRWGEGARVFAEIGCAECHRPYLETESASWTAGPNRDGLAIDLVNAGAAPQPMMRGGKYAVPVFSDFRRHAMGAYLSQLDSASESVLSDRYLTRPLWGMSATGPWMHDGRAPTIDAAIALHGGEGSAALEASRRFEAIGDDKKSALRVFLMSLQRAPGIRVR